MNRPTESRKNSTDTHRDLLFLVWFAILIFGAVQADNYSYYSHQLLRSESSVYMGMLATVLSIIGLFLNFKILGKHSRTFRSLGVLLIAMVPAIFMLVFAYLPSQDVALDFSPGRTAETVLVKKTHGTVKAQDYYDLYYQYIDSGYFSTLVRKSNMTDFARHSEGEKIVLKFHPGYFHMPWYEIQ